MVSPLLEFANSRVLVNSVGDIEVIDGRIVTNNDVEYVVECYLKRIQYTGVSSGSVKIPLASQLDGQMMPGVQGDQFYYRGYGLRYALKQGDGDWDVSDDFEWVELREQPGFLRPGIEVELQFGDDPRLFGIIQRSSGIFGGKGIDKYLYEGIGGVELQIVGGEKQN